MRFKIAVLSASLFFAAVIVASGCADEDRGFLDRVLKGGGSAVPVTVANVVVRERASKIDAPAELTPSDTAEISLPDEVTIERMLVSDGEMVEAGDRLFRISEEDLSTQLAILRADLREAQANLEKNTYFLRNRDRLLDEGRIDRNQYDNLDAEVEANEASVEKTQLQIGQMEDRLANLTITSPVSGAVSGIAASSGLTVPAGRAIMSIVSVNPMIATFKLAAHEATTVKPGMQVGVRLTDVSGERSVGKITSVGTRLDPKTDTFEVKASIPNPTGFLKAGMRADVEFTSSRKQRLYLIPEDALIRERRRYFVFTVIKGVAHKIQVIPSEVRGNRVEIARGLREDDLVVVKGHDKLTEGTVVDIWGR